MAILEINDLHFTFPQLPRKTLSGISLSVAEGEFIVICGPSGCGKTTLLRHMKSELQPHGTREGAVLYRGKPLEDHDPARLAQAVGYVQQDPENQIVMEKVLQELAFGLENFNLSTVAMRQRIAEMASFFGMEAWMERDTNRLSGGEKQLVNLAAVLLLQPEILLLDEPTAQLDPVAAREFLSMLRRLHEDLGLTIIMTEHRLEELFPIADRIIMLEEPGRIRHDGSPREVIRQVHESKDALAFAYLPSMARLFLTADAGIEPPLTFREGRSNLPRLIGGQPPRGAAPQKPAARQISPVLACRDVTFQYERGKPTVVKDLNLTVYEGDLLAIVGGNGAGKSTLLQLLAGLLAPQRGAVKLGGKDIRKLKDRELYEVIGYLPQNPLAYFLHDTVGEELRQAAARSPLPDPGAQMDAYADRFGLRTLLPKHPHDLSGGERQKAALACILLSGAKLLLLDEPTKGIDPFAKQEWGRLLQTLGAEGTTVVFVTHDIEFAAGFANRCAMLFNGAVTAEGAPSQLFGDNFFYTTTINRLLREHLPGVLTYEEVAARWPVPVTHF